MELLEYLQAKMERVAITQFFQVCRDPKDNMVLELAVSGHADYIITGDQDLLILDPFRGIRIMTPDAFLAIP
jgi:putative PIN family toxin of toxin-antitoxin system